MSETEKPANPNRSPRALPLPPVEPAPEVVPPEMREGFFRDRTMSPWRRRNVGRPSER